MAQGIGINTNKISMFIFALGAGMAALGGVIGGAFLGVYPGLDFEMLPIAFAVVIIGDHWEGKEEYGPSDEHAAGGRDSRAETAGGGTTHTSGRSEQRSTARGESTTDTKGGATGKTR